MTFIDENVESEALKPLAFRLEEALADLNEATEFLLRHLRKDVNEAIAGSTDYMHLLGLVGLGYMWGRLAKAAQHKIAAGLQSSHIEAKPTTARFFMNHILPETAVHLARIRAGSAEIMGMSQDAF